MDFPIYRKYKGIDVWFKIESTKQFFEYKRLGQKLITTKIEAKIYPEVQFINDMISCYEDRWVIVPAKDLNDFINS